MDKFLQFTGEAALTLLAYFLIIVFIIRMFQGRRKKHTKEPIPQVKFDEIDVVVNAKNQVITLNSVKPWRDQFVIEHFKDGAVCHSSIFEMAVFELASGIYASFEDDTWADRGRLLTEFQVISTADTACKIGEAEVLYMNIDSVVLFKLAATPKPIDALTRAIVGLDLAEVNPLSVE